MHENDKTTLYLVKQIEVYACYYDKPHHQTLHVCLPPSWQFQPINLNMPPKYVTNLQIDLKKIRLVLSTPPKIYARFMSFHPNYLVSIIGYLIM